MRFYVPKDQISEKQLQIRGTELHHILNVLRLRAGDSITALDGSGGICEVVISSISKHGNPPFAIGEIKSKSQTIRRDIETALFQGLPKYDKMDLVIQKATELGIDYIIPTLCQNTIPELDSDRSDKRVKRWRQIAIEASKQSQRAFLPVVGEIVSFDKAIEESNGDVKIIFLPPSPVYMTRDLRDLLSQKVRKIDIFIGPEGDFSKEEIDKSLDKGLNPVSLGSNILRTETAAIAAAAIILFLSGNL